MSDWFRGVIEGAFVGTPAKAVPDSASEVAPFDVRLYRASISAIEPIAPPDALDESPRSPAAGAPALAPELSNLAVHAAPRAGDGSRPAPAPAPEPAARALRQAELLEVTFVGVGSHAPEQHAAYDLRITNVQLLGSTESDGRLYGRLVGSVVGCYKPSSSVARRAELEREQARDRAAKLGAWVEALRWVFVALAAWLIFGLCGGKAGTLWLAVVVPAAFLRLIASGVSTPSHGVRVFGWAVVLAAATLGGLALYRVSRLECDSALWWLGGMVVAVLVTAVLPSRYPFLWTKVALAASTVALCSLGSSACPGGSDVPSVVSQGPRTDPDGRWPRTPGELPPGVYPSRPLARPISLPEALSSDPGRFRSLPSAVVMVPSSAVFTSAGEVVDASPARQLRELVERFKAQRIVFELHGGAEWSQAGATSLRAWLGSAAGSSSGTSEDVDVVALGAAFPLVPLELDDGSGQATVNERLEIWITPP